MTKATWKAWGVPWPEALAGLEGMLEGVLVSLCLPGAPCYVSTTWQCRGVRLRTVQSSGLQAPPHPPSRGQHLQGSVTEDQSSLSFVEQPLATVLSNPRVSSFRLLYPVGFVMMGNCNPSGY